MPYRDVLVAVGASLALGTPRPELPGYVQLRAYSEFESDAKRRGLSRDEAASFLVRGISAGCPECARHLRLLQFDMHISSRALSAALPHPHAPDAAQW